MVSFRPISRPLSLASRAGLLSGKSCITPCSSFRHISSYVPRASPALVSSSNKPGFLPSSIRTLTTAREKVKVLLVLYDGGKHAQDVSFKALIPETLNPKHETSLAALELQHSILANKQT